MSLESPISVLYDENGIAIAVSSSQELAPGVAHGLPMMGSGSTGAQFIKVSDTGELFVTGSLTTSTGPVDQGNAGTIGQSWYFSLTDGVQVIGDSSGTPIWITGSVDIANPVTVAGTTFNGDNLLVEISGTNVDSNGALLVTGSLNVTPTCGMNSTVSQIAASTVAATVFAANATRVGATFFNEGKETMYLKLGSGASSTSYTAKLTKNAYWELPSAYCGEISVVAAKTNASEFMYATEMFV